MGRGGRQCSEGPSGAAPAPSDGRLARVGAPAIRVYRIPFSTNVERVSLALAHKGLGVEWVDVDPADRTPVVRASGQELVPVLEHDGVVLADSPVILEYLERRFPDPPLLPLVAAWRAEVLIFVDWFNRVWKTAAELTCGRGAEVGAGSRADRGARPKDLGLAPALRGPARRARLPLGRALARRRDRVSVPQVRRALGGGRSGSLPRDPARSPALGRSLSAPRRLDPARRRAAARLT